MTQTNVVNITLIDVGAHVVNLKIDNPVENLTIASITSTLAPLLTAAQGQEPYGLISRYGYAYQSIRSANYEVTTKTNIV